MSGHSKWHRIKHKKAQTDSKRSQLFGRLSREIRVATQQGGTDPSQNASLREAIDRAKKANLPQANIERLLNQDTNNITATTYEGYGPNGVAILVQTATDNTNRTVSEMRALFKKHGGNLGEPNSVLWKFTPCLQTTATLPTNFSEEDLELALIDAGADDFSFDNQEITVTSPVSSEAAIKEILQTYQATHLSSEPTFISPPSQKISLSSPDKVKLTSLLNELSQHSDVESIHHDADISSLS
jgi:YebC/PmpR family DNA-binding regulatory protein